MQRGKSHNELRQHIWEDEDFFIYIYVNVCVHIQILGWGIPDEKKPLCTSISTGSPLGPGDDCLSVDYAAA